VGDEGDLSMQNTENSTGTAVAVAGESMPEIERLKIELASYQSAFRRVSKLLSPETNLEIVTGFREHLVTVSSVREALLIDNELFPEGYKDASKLETRLREWEAFRADFRKIEYHTQGMGCGIEDRGITDRYEACEHGWDQAMDRVAEIMPEEDDGRN
jgi:hypothetical protein